MFEKLNYKMADIMNNSHSECGAVKMTDHFIEAHNVVSDMKIASVIAAIPCARHIADRIKTHWHRLKAML